MHDGTQLMNTAHPLSPMGGHGLNTEICDVWDISWKLAAALSGWGGPQLLESYDTERRPIAHANAAMVNKAAVEVGMPLLTSAQRIGANILVADDETGRKARDDLGLETDKGHWLHDQTGKILGYRYVSPVVIQDEEAGDPPKQEDEITKYIPTTWPGGRPPHVFLVDGKTSIFDHFTKGFSLIDFTPGCEFGKPFSTVSSELGIPLEVVHLPQEQHARDLWERDVVLVRPDGHVAWRSSRSGGPTPTVEAVAAILRQVSGRL
ncbi:uncharacterized protein A1O9_06779 [Exophiala aquamarina CBS 119918]|uniref:FAD-binding domain-containing protein n=1 Tax=Exophiala aquamarina CBS 119918 TaxID=1182545 RepID=A0A072PM21_9EURO|nr:uncharacterized protein A1O9_06779 [Exophiala aquamarina CBS 119918]KEF56590.1 hypothetical protein A1O9_06779 [Exophiala aquamarina CBS 119918]